MTEIDEKKTVKSNSSSFAIFAFALLLFARAGAEVLSTQSITIKPGWNAIYAEVSPLEEIDDIFSDWPTDSVGLYDPATLLSTTQFSSEDETYVLTAAPFASWKRGYPEVSDAERISAGTVLIYFGTSTENFVTSLVGVPAAPRLKWHVGRRRLSGWFKCSHLQHEKSLLPLRGKIC